MILSPSRQLWLPPTVAEMWAMFTAGKRQRNANGKRTRNANGKKVRNTATNTTCCCEGGCTECDPLTEGSTGLDFPRVRGVVSGVTLKTGRCIENPDGDGGPASIQVYGNINGCYCFKDDGFTEDGTGFISGGKSDFIVMREYPDAYADFFIGSGCEVPPENGAQSGFVGNFTLGGVLEIISASLGGGWAFLATGIPSTFPFTVANELPAMSDTIPNPRGGSYDSWAIGSGGTITFECACDDTEYS